MSATELELAWAAGLWDGEGSCSLALYTLPSGQQAARMNVQMQMTDKETILAFSRILEDIPVQSGILAITPKKVQHKPSWHLSIKRIGEAYKLAQALLPYAYTKREHWRLIERFCALRIANVGFREDNSGRLNQGGRARNRWGAEEMAICEQLRALNYRDRPNRSHRAS